MGAVGDAIYGGGGDGSSPGAQLIFMAIVGAIFLFAWGRHRYVLHRRRAEPDYGRYPGEPR